MAAVRDMSVANAGLAGNVKRGLAWSTISSLTLRIGSFATGIILARILTPEQFGVYAIALTVQAILMTLADLGLSADLIRSDDPMRRAPTVATLGLFSGTALALIMAVTSQGVATAMGSPGSASVIALLSVTLAIAGAGVVPYALLQREFRQKAIFVIAFADFIVSTALTVTLVLAGWGVISLAIGRIAAATLTLVLQFAFAAVRPTYRIDRDVAQSVLFFGAPIAVANMLSWALLNIDNVALARWAGPTQLGFYVLAFNISNWPMNVIGQVVRSVALPAFSRVKATTHDASLARAVAITWGLALPAGLLLAVLASPLIHLVYGERWSAAAPVLAGLGLFGAIRVVFDLFAAYLLARGASRAVLAVQTLWFVALAPAVVFAAIRYGIVAAAWAHLVVAVVVVLPAYLVATSRSGADIRRIMLVVWPPLAVGIPCCVVGWAVAGAFDNPLVSLLVGGSATGIAYLLLLGRWLRRAVTSAQAGASPHPSASLPR